ncbi:MAG: GNAT family N-acetyltransferase [Armatimonadaceae bacterium]
MSIEIRLLTEEDHFDHRLLMSHAFSKGNVVQPLPPDAPPPEMIGCWGLLENGKLQAALTIDPFHVHWGPSDVLSLGGIAGVATFADARGRGFVDQLLKQSLLAMKAAGQTVSALYPFAFAFYRKYGWEWVGQKRNVSIPLRELKASPEGRKIEVLSGDGVREKLSDGYTQFARRYRGVFTTETHRWQSKLDHSGNRTTYVYRYEPTGAYMLWRYDSDCGRVREFTAKTPEEYRAFLSLLHYFGTQTEKARVTLPDDTPIQSHLMHWDLNIEVEPVFMGRVVDFGAAMEQITLPPDVPDGTMTLELNDEHAPWNHGIWELTVESGKLTVQTVVSRGGDADVTLDIQALSQAFWGHPSLAALRYAGRVSFANEDGYKLLAALLPATPVYTLDDF